MNAYAVTHMHMHMQPLEAGDQFGSLGTTQVQRSSPKEVGKCNAIMGPC